MRNLGNSWRGPPKRLGPDAMDASSPIGKKLWGGISYTVGAGSDDPNDSPAGPNRGVG
jgi:hypothetical protein